MEYVDSLELQLRSLRFTVTGVARVLQVVEGFDDVAMSRFEQCTGGLVKLKRDFSVVTALLLGLPMEAIDLGDEDSTEVLTIDGRSQSEPASPFSTVRQILAEAASSASYQYSSPGAATLRTPPWDERALGNGGALAAIPSDAPVSPVGLRGFPQGGERLAALNGAPVAKIHPGPFRPEPADGRPNSAPVSNVIVSQPKLDDQQARRATLPGVARRPSPTHRKSTADNAPYLSMVDHTTAGGAGGRQTAAIARPATSPRTP